ncbi:MAG: glycosyltransferase [Candidatus Gracilibacteria bacterium]|nr:glycosyltransferase [Candidatus Gracilibacteria bacterium]
MCKKIINKLLNNEFKKILLLIYKTYFDKPIINFYKTNYKKNVLISYIKYPFIKGVNYSHTNNIEAISIGEVFNKLGYNVDIVNYDYEGKINYEKYNIIFGFGEPLENSFYINSNNIKIFYGTGMNICDNNYNTISRIKEVFNKFNIYMIESGRIIMKPLFLQTTLVDAIICMGNNTITNSYKKYYNGPIYNIPVTYYETLNYKDRLNNFNYTENKINFLWFGSSGLIHRGLDILIELFKKRTDLNLHICGPVDNEIKFKNLYNEEMYNTNNIFTHGFVNIKSDIFNEIVNKCTYVIFPSCAEGEPSAIINLMSIGIIPIATENSGINLELGIKIDSISYHDILKSIDYALSLSNSDIIKKSKLCAKNTLKRNNIKNYKYILKNNLIDIIKD